jgi:6-methylsalicylate decarboxylase
MTSPRRIDVHFHLLPQFYCDMVYAAGRGPAMGRYPAWSPELALEAMDRFGIETALTSLGQPGVGFVDPEAARALARRCNEYAADMNMKWPKRFGAFATLPMSHPDHTIAEIDHALDTLKFAGVNLFASYGEIFLGDPDLDPVMEALNARDAVVFLHPGLNPSSQGLKLPWPAFMMEYLFDTTRAAANLVFGGALERFPNIRFILPHAGGLVPYFSWRLAQSPAIDPRMPQKSYDEVMRLLGRFWYDNALSPGEAAWASLRTVASPDRIVFGSDWPFGKEPVIAEAVRTYEALDSIGPELRAAIDRGNALSLFPSLR